MGTDDLAKKRKAKKREELARKEAKKSPYKKILIICEGAETEVRYFNSLIKFYRLGTVGIKVVPAPSSCPLANVGLGIEEYKNGGWDLVYCVFDKDSHPKYRQAIEKLEKAGDNIIGAHSVPCFEFWILLHFTNTSKSFYGNPKRPAGDEVIRDLKKYIKNYSKSMNGLFDLTKSNLEKAIHMARIINAESIRSGTDDPSTYVGELVSVLKVMCEAQES